MPMDAKGAHTMNDWTDKINVENGENVHGMEKDGDAKEAEPPKACHIDKKKVEPTSYQRIKDYKVGLEGP